MRRTILGAMVVCAVFVHSGREVQGASGAYPSQSATGLTVRMQVFIWDSYIGDGVGRESSWSGLMQDVWCRADNAIDSVAIADHNCDFDLCGGYHLFARQGLSEGLFAWGGSLCWWEYLDAENSADVDPAGSVLVVWWTDQCYYDMCYEDNCGGLACEAE